MAKNSFIPSDQEKFFDKPDRHVKEVIEAYDRIAERYRDARSNFKEQRLVDHLVTDLPPGAMILDVGCGCGIPLGRHLIEKGCSVTGLDASRRLLDLARQAVPDMALKCADMRAFEPVDSFDAIVAWDSVFHVPRVEHEALFQKFYSWLRPGGRLLISLGGSAGEFTSEMLGETFFYSGHDPAESLRLLEKAGFEILHQEIDDPSSRGHLVVIGQTMGA